MVRVRQGGELEWEGGSNRAATLTALEGRGSGSVRLSCCYGQPSLLLEELGGGEAGREEVGCVPFPWLFLDFWG